MVHSCVHACVCVCEGWSWFRYVCTGLDFPAAACLCSSAPLESNGVKVQEVKMSVDAAPASALWLYTCVCVCVWGGCVLTLNNKFTSLSLCIQCVLRYIQRAPRYVHRAVSRPALAVPSSTANSCSDTCEHSWVCTTASPKGTACPPSTTGNEALTPARRLHIDPFTWESYVRVFAKHGLAPKGV